MTGECSNRGGLRWLSCKTWKLSVLGKVKRFIWCAYHETLPTNYQLHKRKIRSSAICPIYLQEDKTMRHILWQCAMARNIWALVPRRMQKLPNYGGEYSLFMKRIFTDFSKEDTEEWVVIMWSIWNARNHFVHDEIHSDPLVIKNGALSLQRDFKMAKSSLNPPKPVG